MCAGLWLTTKDNKVRRLILPSRSAQWNKGDRQEFSLSLGGSADSSLLLTVQ